MQIKLRWLLFRIISLYTLPQLIDSLLLFRIRESFFNSVCEITRTHAPRPSCVHAHTCIQTHTDTRTDRQMDTHQCTFTQTKRDWHSPSASLCYGLVCLCLCVCLCVCFSVFVSMSHWVRWERGRESMSVCAQHDCNTNVKMYTYSYCSPPVKSLKNCHCRWVRCAWTISVTIM